MSLLRTSIAFWSFKKFSSPRNATPLKRVFLEYIEYLIKTSRALLSFDIINASSKFRLIISLCESIFTNGITRSYILSLSAIFEIDVIALDIG